MPLIAVLFAGTLLLGCANVDMGTRPPWMDDPKISKADITSAASGVVEVGGFIGALFRAF